MKERKQDLRIARTRSGLCKALLDLMEEKSFNKINVNDICEKAKVHRATFYNHFASKEDLLNFALDEIQEDLFEKTISKGSYTTQKEMFMDIASSVIDFMRENKQKIIKIINNSPEKMSTILYETLKQSIVYLSGKNKYKNKYTVPVEVIISFMTGGFAMIGIDWVMSNNKYSKQDLLNYLNILLDDKLFLKD